MTALPDLPAPGGAPLGLNELRESVQGLLLHKEWAAAYGVEPDAAVLDEVAELVTSDDFDEIRRRFESDGRLRVPRQITSYVNGEAVRVRLDDPRPSGGVAAVEWPEGAAEQPPRPYNLPE